jgi:glycosyltransferase involved in cell wall biosynthesis
MSTPVLGYVIRMFPQVSETFIANEILGLERLGVQVRIFSYRRPQEDVRHECVQAIRAPITYLPDPLYSDVFGLAGAQQFLARSAPLRYNRVFRHAALETVRQVRLEPWQRLLQSAYLARLLKESDVTWLHAHFGHGATHVAMLASMLTGLPFSFTAHARDIYANASPALLVSKMRAAQWVATCTAANQRQLQGLLPASLHSKVRLAYHGVDSALFSPASEVAGSPPLILSVGRLVEKKGFPQLLAACRVLADKGVEFKCEIVGGGPERAHLEGLLDQLSLRSFVSLVGVLSQEQVAAKMRAAAVFALPCKVLPDGDRDGIPNVLLEAMASAVPVVTSPMASISEAVDSGRNGLLVGPENSHELAAAIELLLRDPGLRARLGAAGRTTVRERFELSRSAGRLAELFGVLGTKAPA